MKEFISSYEDYVKFTSTIQKNQIVNILFTGKKDEATGISWCPDCVDAQPFLAKALEKYGNEQMIFVEVDVGNRETWKTMDNPYRKDKLVHLQVIPTLVRWSAPQRLEGDQLLKDELLQMFFCDED